MTSDARLDESAQGGLRHAVFVYGTLMRGNRAEYLLRGAEYRGRFALDGFGMYQLSGFPGIVPEPGKLVLGEVYLVDDAILANLDKYEGEGSLYSRRTVEVKTTENTLSVQTYVFLGKMDKKNAISAIEQPWKNKKEGDMPNKNDLLWYACYGSNLLKERFLCYIQGGVCKHNGKEYEGCNDSVFRGEEDAIIFPGRLYFAEESLSWSGKGVAFFDPAGDGQVQMRLYLVTRGQLADIKKQEGPGWYGNEYCLGIGKNERPIYTLTSPSPQSDENMPSPEYRACIAEGLGECGYSEKDAEKYLDLWVNRQK